VGEAKRPVEGEFQVAPGLHMLAYMVEVIPVGEFVNDASFHTAQADIPVIELQIAAVDKAQAGRFHGCEFQDLFLVFLEISLDELNSIMSM
jgi:hypothetical protein